MNITQFFRSYKYSLFIILAALCIFLPTWTVTQELEDIKYIFAFIFFACLMLSRRFCPSRDCSGAISPTSKIYWIMFAAYIVYTLGNWHFLSYQYYGTRSMVYMWFCFLSFLLGALVLSRPQRLIIIGIGCIIAGVIASCYSIGEYLAIIPYYNPESWPPRVTGLLAHKNAFALFVMISGIWTSYFIFSGMYKKWNPLLIAAFFLQFAALLIGDARGTLILTGMGLIGVIAPLLYKKGLLKKQSARFSLYVVFFFCALIPLVISGDYFWSRLANLALFIDGGALTRLYLYEAEWKLFLAHPLFGCGVGNFVFENIPFWSESFRKSIGAFFFAHNAESDFLETLTETGLIGLGFYCFFLFGAVINGIRQLKHEWRWETYIVVVLVILLLCNGIYDTALRRLPCGIMLWAFAGYLWKSQFIAIGSQWSSKSRFYLRSTAFLVHCMFAVFFVRILVGDFYFRQSYVSEKNPNPQSGKLLLRALQICPFHQDALFQEAYVGLRTGEYDFTLRIVDQLNRRAPHFMPTSFLKGLCAAGQKRYADALFFANEEIRRNPNYIDAYELKVNALAGLGKCQEMSRLQDSLCIPLRDESAFIHWGDTITSSTLKKMYLKETGKFRAWAGGRRLKEAFRRYLTIGREQDRARFVQLHGISRIQCAQRSKE
jgi:hypothetical protein